MNDISLEGDITVPGGPKDEELEVSTLDEPVKATVMRDVKAVGVKFLHVIYPKQSSTLLKEWDLWGPLVLCLLMGILLKGDSGDSKDGSPEFAEVFIIYWVGAVIVTLNTKLLGGNISFFQSVCVLGYCVCPLTVALLVCKVLLFFTQSVVLFILRLILVFLAFGWSTFASTAFLAESQPPNRKALAIFPIFLFYFIISWLIVSHS